MSPPSMSPTSHENIPHFLDKLNSNNFQTIFCFASGLFCFIPVILDMQSYVENSILAESLVSSSEFDYSCIASIALVIPLFVDVFLDLMMNFIDASSSAEAKKLKPKPIETSARFNFLNISERLLILMGVIILPLVNFLPKETKNLALTYLCAYKCQQNWVGGIIVVSLCRYDREYWSISSTLVSLSVFSIGLISGSFVDNYSASESSPSFIMILVLAVFLLTHLPLLVFLWNSIRWLIVVYFKCHHWKNFLFFKSTNNSSPQNSIRNTPPPAVSTVDHTFFPMVYITSGIFLLIMLGIVVGIANKIQDFNRLNLLQNNVPYLVFSILISTLSMRMVKFEVVQGLVSYI